MNAKEIKKNSYAPQTSNTQRAKADRKMAKKYKNDVTTKVGFYDTVTKCHSFANTQEKLDRQVNAIRFNQGKVI